MADTTTLADLPSDAAALGRELAEAFAKDRPEPASDGAAAGTNGQPAAAAQSEGDNPPEAGKCTQFEGHAIFAVFDRCKNELLPKMPAAIQKPLSRLVHRYPLSEPGGLLSGEKQAEFRDDFDRKHPHLLGMQTIMEAILKDQGELTKLRKQPSADAVQGELTKANARITELEGQVKSLTTERDGFKTKLETASADKAKATPDLAAVEARENQIRTEATATERRRFSTGIVVRAEEEIALLPEALRAPLHTQAQAVRALLDGNDLDNAWTATLALFSAVAKAKDEAQRRRREDHTGDERFTERVRSIRRPDATEDQWNALPGWAKWTIGGFGGGVAAVLIGWLFYLVISM